MTWNYPDGFDPRLLDRKFDLDSDTDELARQIVENDDTATYCDAFEASEYLFEFFGSTPIPTDFLDEVTQVTTQKMQTLRAQK